jgi:hypothetical protein
MKMLIFFPIQLTWYLKMSYLSILAENTNHQLNKLLNLCCGGG